ncbi:uncharacterized protein LOC124169381 [Ischnura elegans]|uniref:uncharacterized protein LOC124169381 n=1 Tax=Ischnura elegans TaxID=197161 RepID=UPI001ED88955|nr:uncharacterized protein LOC124169381 [Ischnura elegans]
MSRDFDTEVLICEVQASRHLWDPSIEEYKNRELRMKTWQKISRKIVPDFESLNEADKTKCVNKVQKRWKTARDAYFKGRNTMSKNKSKSAAAKRTKYVHHDRLTFLDCVQGGSTESNFDSGSQDIHADDQPRLDNSTQVQNESAPPKPVLKRKKTADNPEFEDNLVTLLKDIKEREDDDDRAFLMSLLPTMRSLNHDENLFFRCQVMQLLYSIKTQPNISIPDVPPCNFPYPTTYNCGPSSANVQRPRPMQSQPDPCVSNNVASPSLSPASSSLSVSS